MDSYKGQGGILDAPWKENLARGVIGYVDPSIYQMNRGRYFENFVYHVASDHKNYILDFPDFLEALEVIPSDIFIDPANQSTIIDENGVEHNSIDLLIYNLLKYALSYDLNDYKLAKASLRAISTLLLTDFIDLMHKIITTNVAYPNRPKTNLLQELPRLVENAKKKKTVISLLIIISVISTALDIENTFFNFFVNNLKLERPREVLLAAEKAAIVIIKAKPHSEFAINIMKDLPFDEDDVEISRFCFRAIGEQCNKGNVNCFELPSIIKYICDERYRKDALFILNLASFHSENICYELLKYLDDLYNALDFPTDKYVVCLIIINIASRGEQIAKSLIPFLIKLPELYDNSPIKDKIEIARTAGLIINYGKLRSAEELNRECIMMTDSLYFADNDAIVNILDALFNLKYFNEEFHQCLLQLTDSDDELIAKYAQLIINRLEEYYSINDQ
ncbi:hypothetical protein TRFO_12936 [Tritrichomonas foetus]|uniref:Clathrin/coatomer adaptor adaptin-like N-terminal domain-containing protein n=1 Tax=Tritrichomonas foetus TaxID=1144522 RepID=A0A1J4L004_9EUKA|nr:hypothetical protein TRFO_12936 [Tritrichomonas foetus]|eukprot:OHT16841.1 hypothetical protein TRFO_12936 [Tritrichomonas foetus]